MRKIKEWIEDNRKSSINVGIVILVVILIISILFIRIGLNKNRKKYVQYSDNKNLEFKVMLKQNEYYKNPYLEKGNQYIANLIENINADFNYNFNLNHEYEYNYKVIATVEVLEEKNNKSVYTFSEDLVGEKTGINEGNLEIAENINIDFNKYNNLIKQFVSTYDLKNVSSKLNVDLKMGVKGTNQKFSKQDFKVMSLEVPLTTNTIAIDTNYDLAESNLIEVKQYSTVGKVMTIAGVCMVIVDALCAVALVVFVKKTETDEEKYNNELRKIISNYDSCISKLDDDFNMKGYQILKVQKFADLLEIRDTMQLPIIMIENKEKSVTCFAIPTPSKILYFYSISIKQYALSVGKNDEDKEMRNVDEQKV